MLFLKTKGSFTNDLGFGINTLGLQKTWHTRFSQMAKAVKEIFRSTRDKSLMVTHLYLGIKGMNLRGSEGTKSVSDFQTKLD